MQRRFEEAYGAAFSDIYREVGRFTATCSEGFKLTLEHLQIAILWRYCQYCAKMPGLSDKAKPPRTLAHISPAAIDAVIALAMKHIEYCDGRLSTWKLQALEGEFRCFRKCWGVHSTACPDYWTYEVEQALKR